MKETGVGLLGFGTIGAGVVDALEKNRNLLADRLGIRPVIRRIADIDLESDRGVKVDEGVLCNDAKAVIDDPQCEIIVELIGGTGVAVDFVKRSLRKGKPVVTANKAMLAENGNEIFKLAEESGVDLFFGASVGGGIPIIRVMRECLVGNRIKSIFGILNGTCNYILTRMEKEQISFEKALTEAQEKGYAEAEPSLDIDGVDTAHKAAILASLACGRIVPMEAIHVEGIRNLQETDISYAMDLGYRIKVLAVIKQENGLIEVRVQPTLVPLDHMLSSVNGVFNAVMIKSDLLGDTLYYGKGAGREPTASTVVADIGRAAVNIGSGSVLRDVPVPNFGEVDFRQTNDIRSRYYLRLSVLDKPGAFAKIAHTLGNHNVSIASIMQKQINTSGYVPVVIVTHKATRLEVDGALAEIDSDDMVNAGTVKFMIEE